VTLKRPNNYSKIDNVYNSPVYESGLWEKHPV